jgi:demethylmenaquinone methyltransferase / 2-methoxy-6-polyprenyl-1,4-benzoquinol methylase
LTATDNYKQIAALNADAHLTGRAKAEYVEAMFNSLAARYDTMNRIISLGQDLGWRKSAARLALRATTVQQALAAGRVPTALDLASGSGDFAFILARQGCAVVALDFAVQMLNVGRARQGNDRDLADLELSVAQIKAGPTTPGIAWVQGDALHLPFEGGSFDCAVSGFAMRNVTDIGAAFREMAQVVRRGGRVVCLEVARPSSALLRLGHYIHTHYLVPLMGRLLASQGEAYRYLPNSMTNFPPPSTLKQIMEQAGLRRVRYSLHTFGSVAIHVGEVN